MWASSPGAWLERAALDFLLDQTVGTAAPGDTTSWKKNEKTRANRYQRAWQVTIPSPTVTIPTIPTTIPFTARGHKPESGHSEERSMLSEPMRS